MTNFIQYTIFLTQRGIKIIHYFYSHSNNIILFVFPLFFDITYGVATSNYFYNLARGYLLLRSSLLSSSISLTRKWSRTHYADSCSCFYPYKLKIALKSSIYDINSRKQKMQANRLSEESCVVERIIVVYKIVNNIYNEDKLYKN